MSIATWTQFLDRLAVLIDGDNASSASVGVASLTAIVAQGEERIYREVQSRFNEKAFTSVTVTSNLATIPADFKSASVVHFGKKSLLPVSEEWLREYLNDNPTGDCIYFAKAGPSFQFGPAVTDGTALQGRYFCTLPPLGATTLPTNSLFAASNDLFIYAALSESAPFFNQEAKIPLWETKYASARDALNKETHRAAYSAGRMRRKPSTAFIR